MKNNEKILELLIRKSTLKDVELCLYKQYKEIDEEIAKLRESK